MATQYTLVFALLAFTCALVQGQHGNGNGNGNGNDNGNGNANSDGPRDDGGGCCFYSEKKYKGKAVCSSRPFNHNEFAVQSFFCTDGFAGSLRKKNEVIAIVFCADQLPETLQAIDADQIMVSPCPRYQCCFYTEDNLGGDEYCIPDNSPPKLHNVYKSYTCLPSWKPRLNNGANVACPAPGTSQPFAAPVKHVDIDTEACPPPADAPRAENSDLDLNLFQEEQNMANFEENNADMANFEESNFGLENMASAEDSFENMANIDEVGNMQGDDVQQEEAFASNDGSAQLEAANFAQNNELESLAVDESAAAMAVEDVQFVEFADSFEGDAAAMSGATETLGNSAAGIASAFVALVVGVAFMLA